MKAATCPDCGAAIWVPAYDGDGAPDHRCRRCVKCYRTTNDLDRDYRCPDCRKGKEE